MKRVELYDAGSLPEKHRRKKKLRTAMLCIGGIGLSVCILLCVLATRKNQGLLLPLTIGVSILTGWIVITILHGPFGCANADVRHCELMLNEPRAVQRGSFRKTDEVRHMRNGITKLHKSFLWSSPLIKSFTSKYQLIGAGKS